MQTTPKRLVQACTAALKQAAEKSNAMSFLEQFCGKLLDYGVMNGA